MAQEVQNVMPETVTRDTDGYLRVSYDKLCLPFETYDQWLATGARLPVPKMGAHGKPVLVLHPKDFSGALVEIEQS